jgi:hypothetical protein
MGVTFVKARSDEIMSDIGDRTEYIYSWKRELSIYNRKVHGKFIMTKKAIILFVLSISLIISFFSLCFAQAETWVLWERTDSIKKSGKHTYWEIIHAYPVHKQCLKEMQRSWQMMREKASEDKIKSDTISEVEGVPYRVITTFRQSQDTMSVTSTYYCLPGTSDPREKK